MALYLAYKINHLWGAVGVVAVYEFLEPSIFYQYTGLNPRPPFGLVYMALKSRRVEVKVVAEKIPSIYAVNYFSFIK